MGHWRELQRRPLYVVTGTEASRCSIFVNAVFSFPYPAVVQSVVDILTPRLAAAYIATVQDREVANDLLKAICATEPEN